MLVTEKYKGVFPWMVLTTQGEHHFEDKKTAKEFFNKCTKGEGYLVKKHIWRCSDGGTN